MVVRGEGRVGGRGVRGKGREGSQEGVLFESRSSEYLSFPYV